MRHVEDSIQMEMIAYCRKSRVLFLAFRVENEGQKSKQQAMRAKRMGNLAGVTDIVIPLPYGGIAFIEVKTKTGKTSKVQKELHIKLKKLGHEVYVVYGLHEGMAILKQLEGRYLK